MMTPRQLGFFWRKLQTMLQVGLPLMEGLRLIQKQASSAPERLWVASLMERLTMGMPFSAAATGLTPMEREVLRAAERTGEFASVVGTLAEQFEERESLHAQVRSALSYPILVGVVCIGLWVFLTSVVLPRFEKLFVSMGVSGGLPPFTQGVINFSKFMGAGGWVLALALFVFIWVGIARAPMRSWRRIPIVGPLRRRALAERFFSTMALLTRSGVPLQDSLASALSICHVPAATASALVAQVTDGESLSGALRRLGVFDLEDLEIIAIAQTTAALPSTTDRLARLHRERYRIELRQTVGLMEPLLIIAMAVSVATLVAALFAPLLPLISRLSEGV